MTQFVIFHSAEWHPMAMTISYNDGVTICTALSLSNPGHVYILATEENGAVGSSLNGDYEISGK